MNVSYKWLKEYVDFDLTPQETADALTLLRTRSGRSWRKYSLSRVD